MMLTFFINSFYNMKNILNLKERGRSSVGRYHTKQQTRILEYLALKKDTAFTAESVWRGLLGGEEKVGRATVYRALDRLVEAGTILKIPSGDGNRALYRYMGEAALPSSGRMVCLDCGRAFPLECSHLEELTRHIQSDHQFEVDTRHTVLYGHCCDCGK